MPTLKHNKIIRVRPKSVKSIISHVKHRLKPSPVRALGKVQINKPKAAKPKQRVVAMKRTPLVARPTRQLPSARLRTRSRQLIVSNKSHTKKTGLSNPEALQRVKGRGKGRVLVIVSNGPSHKKAALPILLAHETVDIMSVNKPDDRLWPTAFWIFCDNSQYRRHKSLWSAFKGVLINSAAIRDTKPNTVQIKTLHGKGFSSNLAKGMFVGRSTTYAALQVALYMNYDHIYVFGCDMGKVDGQLYPWGSNPDVADQSRIKRFKQEAEHYGWMVKNTSAETRKKITFCSEYNKWPFVKHFEMLKHNEAVDIIIKRVTKSQSN